MIKLRVLKPIAYSLFLGVSILMPFFSVDASYLKPSVKLSSTNGFVELMSQVNEYSKEYESDFYYFSSVYTTTGGVNVSVDTRSYLDLSMSDKQELMSDVLVAIQGSSLIAIDRSKLYNFVCKQDSSVSSVVRRLSSDSQGDFYKAYSYVKPFTGRLGTGLALFCIVLFMLLTISVLLDMSFMTIPLISVFLLRGDEKKKPKLVSAEAYKAYLQGIDASNKKDVLFIFIGHKWLHLVTVSVCILYLASGKIWGLVADIIDLFSGVVGR